MIKLFLITFLSLYSSLVSANIMYGTGTYVPYFNKVQTGKAGETQKFELNPYLSIGTQFHLKGKHFFLPEFGYTYFLDVDEGFNKEIIFLHYNMGYVLTDRFILRYGISNNWYRIKGAGGSDNLRNGDSLREYPAPSKTITSYFSTLNLGSEFFFNQKKNSVRLDLHLMQYLDFEQERIYNYLFSVNFYR